jgi:hypothetical protein
MIYNTNQFVKDSPLIVWDNVILGGYLSASSSADGFPVTGLLNSVTTDPWKPSAMPATLSVDLGSASYCNALCFAAHDMGTRGVTITLERLVGVDWIGCMSITPDSDEPIIMSFPAREATEWRVVFSGDNTFRLSVMTLGRALMVPGRIIPPHVPLHRASTIKLVGATESGTGEFLQADFERAGGSASFQFSAQYPEFALSDEFEGFRQHFNRGRAFFMACFPTHEPRDMGMLWRAPGGSDILAPYRDAVFMDLAMECGIYVG